MTNVAKTVLMIAVAAVAFGAGLLLGARGELQATMVLSGPEEQPEHIDLDPVWKAWRLLDDRFVPSTTTEPLTEQDRIWGMIEGLAKAYDDPYTTFLPPRESHNFEEEISGIFGGVGVEIGFRDEILTVIAPLKGTPGDLAGLRSGDLIIRVDGVQTRAMNIDDAIERIRGEVGTEVVLTIAREGEQEFLEIPVIRDVIKIPTIETELRDDGVFYIALYNFGGTAEREMRTALREYIASDAEKLIFDVRGNPGGYLEAAVEIASYFLPLGKTVVIEDHGTEGTEERRSRGYDIGRDVWDMVVLIDRGSASASEILAGALREHGYATLMGTQTFGKGSVQELLEVTPETSLKVTIARWLTPNGVSLSNNGLMPDHEVRVTREDLEAERDPQLEAAAAFLLTGTIPVAEEAVAATTTSATSTPETP